MSLLSELAKSAELKADAKENEAAAARRAKDEEAKKQIAELIEQACEEQIPSELREELNMELRLSRTNHHNQLMGWSGCLAFPLIDETDQRLQGSVTFTFKHFTSQIACEITSQIACEISGIRMPSPDKNGDWPASRGRSSVHKSHCDRLEGCTWGETLALLVQTWNEAMDRNRHTLAEQRQERAEREAEAERKRQHIAEVERKNLADFNIFCEEARAIEAQITDHLADILVDMTTFAAPLTLYRWTWQTGGVLDEESGEAVADYDSGFSLSSELDADGWVFLCDRGIAVKLIPRVHFPVVEKFTVTGMDDLTQLWRSRSIRLIQSRSLQINGVTRYSYGCHGAYEQHDGWKSDGALTYRADFPVSWLLTLVGLPAEVPTQITLEPTEVEQVTWQAFTEKWGDRFKDDKPPF